MASYKGIQDKTGSSNELLQDKSLANYYDLEKTYNAAV